MIRDPVNATISILYGRYRGNTVFVTRGVRQHEHANVTLPSLHRLVRVTRNHAGKTTPFASGWFWGGEEVE